MGDTAGFRKRSIRGQAEDILRELRESLIERFSSDDRSYIGGYSLAGLFASWAAYRMDSIEEVAVVYTLVWFHRFFSGRDGDMYYYSICYCGIMIILN